MNLKRLIRLFVADMLRMNKAEHTIRSYSYDLEHLRTYLLQENADEIDNESAFKKHIFAYMSTIESDTKYDEATINRKRSCFRSFIGFLFECKYIKEDFSSDLAFTRNDSPPDLILLTGEEIERILEIHDRRIHYGKNEEMRFMHRRNRLAFNTMLQLGIKVNELLRLKWDNIKFQESKLVVPKRKGIEHRIFVLPPSLLLEFEHFRESLKKLENYDDSFLKGYIFFGAGKTPTYPLNPKTIERMVGSLTEEAAITGKHITAQSLRNTMVSYHLKMNTKIEQLTPMLGYSRNSVTKNMYNKQKKNTVI